MTIFICIDWFYPAYKAGGPVQSIANLVAQYHSPGINFRIFCSNTDLDGTIVKGVPFDEWVDHNAHTRVWYASRVNARVLKNEVAAAGTDILFINGIYSWYFNFLPLLVCKAPRKIISARGMLHPGALSQKSAKKKIYLACWKILRIPERCQFHASTVAEQAFVREAFGRKTEVFIASNFPRTFSLQAAPAKLEGALKLISIALISPMKNHLLVTKALSYCKETIRYDIYGPIKDESYWKECLLAIKLLPHNITVSYHGDIDPEKVAQALTGGEVFILPSKSENFGHAIYEALSAGKPVITSHGTPWNDLSAKKAGINVDPVDEKAMAKAIAFFAAMPATTFQSWNEGARQYAVGAVDIKAIRFQYDAMFYSDTSTSY